MSATSSAPVADREASLFRGMTETRPGFTALTGALAALVAWGAIAYALQLRDGLGVTGLRDHIMWGLYITNFVFFIGISHAGTLISAILRVTGAEWRRPITRLAEAITVFSLMVAAPMVVIDMGRPDRILNVLRFGRLQSPILWDVLSITTYLTGSLLYLYLPLIPDVAVLRESPGLAAWRRRLYGVLALGWTGTARQRAVLERAIATMAIVIIPVAVSVHTVVSWIFGMTLRAGWNSTIFGPYFVFGAIFSGIAAVIVAMAAFRWLYHLEGYITTAHFRRMGYLLLALALIYGYFTFAEYLTPAYKMAAAERGYLGDVLGGPFAGTFWFTQIGGVLIPILLLILSSIPSAGRRVTPVATTVAAAVLVTIGAWWKRFIIIVPTLQNPFLPIQRAPAGWAFYQPTWVEWSITAAAVAGFILIYLLFSRAFPIVSIWETREESPRTDVAGLGEAAGVPAP